MLILNVKTCWSSTHQMLCKLDSILQLWFWFQILGRALGFKDAVQNFVAKDRNFHEWELSDADWDAIKKVMHWLKLFWSATTDMSATKCPMLSSTILIFWGLQESIKAIIWDLSDFEDIKLWDGLVEAHLKLSDYFTKFDDSDYCTWASHGS